MTVQQQLQQQRAPVTTAGELAADKDPDDTDCSADHSIAGHRWVVLVLLSLLNMQSDLACFSLAPLEEIADDRFKGLHSGLLVVFFLTANVVSCCAEPAILQRFGLRRTVLGGALLMLLGNLLKSGLPEIAANSSAALVLLGSIVVGLAQPLFQITAVTLVQDWFPAHERLLATMLTVSSNQLGIGLAYLLGNLLVSDSATLGTYLSGITGTTLVLVVFTAVLFRSQPEQPPSKSAAASRAHPAQTLSVTGYWRSAASMRSVPGFWLTVLIFCTGAAVVNTCATFLPDLLASIGHSSRVTVGALGAGFQLAVMLGSATAGVLLHNLERGATVLLTLTAAALAVASVLFSCKVLAGVVPAVVAIGAVVGPLQPLAADLGIEAVYPHSENDVLLVCVLTANVVSAAILSLNYALKGVTVVHYVGSLYMLTGATACTLMLFVLLFKGKLNRQKFDGFDNSSSSSSSTGRRASATAIQLGSSRPDMIATFL
jgi:MFS transporter, FLVCR family, MFS-domain-containing protein 7